MIRDVLDWPYTEGLRLDEAMHPLTLLAVGRVRRGAAQPERRAAAPGGAVEYGFKSAKSIVTIRLTEKEAGDRVEQVRAAGVRVLLQREPEVRHPRWSQAAERRIGELRKRPTQMFNGYADQVAGPTRAWT